MRHENAILLELFRHNLWANAVMLNACRGLSADQLSTELAGTYGRLDHTLVHLARAQGGDTSCARTSGRARRPDRSRSLDTVGISAR